jgi:DNA-3-methyladenine glycosylase I
MPSNSPHSLPQTRHSKRCDWCGDDPVYVAYHDSEWGRPIRDPNALFERLILEGMQAGLSWYTVLCKRERMREQFFEFDPIRIASRGPARIRRWLDDPGLIRHRGKLEAMVSNAVAYLALDGGFAELVWSFVDGEPVQSAWRDVAEVPSKTAASEAMAIALKHAGFRFVGPTTCYAFMQSAGLVNDHLLDCMVREECAQARPA